MIDHLNICIYLYIYIFIPAVCDKIDVEKFLLTQLSLSSSFQATAQMKEQVKKSSSIIVALTDGKLEPYIHQLTKEEVSWYLTCRFFSDSGNKQLHSYDCLLCM